MQTDAKGLFHCTIVKLFWSDQGKPR